MELYCSKCGGVIVSCHGCVVIYGVCTVNFVVVSVYIVSCSYGVMVMWRCGEAAERFMTILCV